MSKFSYFCAALNPCMVMGCKCRHYQARGEWVQCSRLEQGCQGAISSPVFGTRPK